MIPWYHPSLTPRLRDWNFQGKDSREIRDTGEIEEDIEEVDEVQVGRKSDSEELWVVCPTSRGETGWGFWSEEMALGGRRPELINVQVTRKDRRMGCFSWWWMD
jgi:hypothetical protein